MEKIMTSMEYMQLKSELSKTISTMDYSLEDLVKYLELYSLFYDEDFDLAMADALCDDTWVKQICADMVNKAFIEAGTNIESVQGWADTVKGDLDWYMRLVEKHLDGIFFIGRNACMSGQIKAEGKLEYLANEANVEQMTRNLASIFWVYLTSICPGEEMNNLGRMEKYFEGYDTMQLFWAIMGEEGDLEELVNIYYKGMEAYMASEEYKKENIYEGVSA